MTNNDYIDLPSEFFELDAYVSKQVSEGKIFRSHTNYYERLKFVTRTYFDSQHKNVLMKIAEHWLLHFESCIVNKSGYDIYQNELDNFIRFVSEHHLVRDIAAVDNKANTLVYLLMARVGLVMGSIQHPEYDNVGDVLKQWSGLDYINQKAMLTMEGLVSHMYGEAAWDLYGAGLSWDVDIPGIFWKLNLPLSSLYNPSTTTVDIDSSVTFI